MAVCYLMVNGKMTQSCFSEIHIQTFEGKRHFGLIRCSKTASTFKDLLHMAEIFISR